VAIRQQGAKRLQSRPRSVVGGERVRKVEHDRAGGRYGRAHASAHRVEERLRGVGT
jgi:hypothetical protein